MAQGERERRGLLRNKKWYRLGSSLPKKRREAAVTQILTLTAPRMVARSERSSCVVLLERLGIGH